MNAVVSKYVLFDSDRLNRQSNADNMHIVIGVVVSVLIIFVGGSIIHVILWRRKKSTTLQVPSGKVSLVNASNTYFPHPSKKMSYVKWDDIY